MKKTYITPKIEIVPLNGGAVCQSLTIGSGNTDATSGDGNDLVHEESSWDIWGDD